MEAVVMILTACGVFAAGTVARFTLLPVVLALLAVPVLAIVMAARAAEMLWRRAVGLGPAGGLLWKAT